MARDSFAFLAVGINVMTAAVSFEIPAVPAEQGNQIFFVMALLLVYMIHTICVYVNAASWKFKFIIPMYNTRLRC